MGGAPRGWGGAPAELQRAEAARGGAASGAVRGPAPGAAPDAGARGHRGPLIQPRRSSTRDPADRLGTRWAEVPP